MPKRRRRQSGIMTKKKKLGGTSYQSRSYNLSVLGFSSYKEYLASALWKEIRRKVYSIKGDRCFMCERQATELHHNRYHLNDLKGKKIKYISPVCRGCHEYIEFDMGHNKGTVLEARKKFKRARKTMLNKKFTKTTLPNKSAPMPQLKPQMPIDLLRGRA